MKGSLHTGIASVKETARNINSNVKVKTGNKDPDDNLPQSPPSEHHLLLHARQHTKKETKKGNNWKVAKELDCKYQE